MKLYFSPFACSQAVHIIAQEAGIPLELVQVNIMGDHKTKDGGDYVGGVNPKGYVPTLELDNGERLTEASVVMQYLADKVPDKKLAPAAGTMERYRVQEMLNFLSSEIHKTFGLLFNPGLPAEFRTDRVEHLKKRFAVVEKQLAKGPYLFGEQFTVADSYLFVMTNWLNFIKLDLSAELPNVMAFVKRVGERPAVQTAQGIEAAAMKQ